MRPTIPPQQPPAGSLPQALSGALVDVLSAHPSRSLAELAGLGTDVQEIAPFATRPYACDPAFYERVFSEQERAYCLACAAPAQHFAARFAAKEAVVKAFGAVCTLSPIAIEILRLPSGAPVVHLSAEATALVGDAFRTFVSMGHCEDWAYAVALVTHAGLPAPHLPHEERAHD